MQLVLFQQLVSEASSVKSLSSFLKTAGEICYSFLEFGVTQYLELDLPYSFPPTAKDCTSTVDVKQKILDFLKALINLQIAELKGSRNCNYFLKLFPELYLHRASLIIQCYEANDCGSPEWWANYWIHYFCMSNEMLSWVFAILLIVNEILKIIILFFNSIIWFQSVHEWNMICSFSPPVSHWFSPVLNT